MLEVHICCLEIIPRASQVFLYVFVFRIFSDGFQNFVNQGMLLVLGYFLTDQLALQGSQLGQTNGR